MSQNHYFPAPAQRSNSGGPRWAIIGIFLIMLFGAITAARDFLMPVTLAVLLFFVFAPLRRMARRMGIPSGVTAAVVCIGMISAVFGIGYVASGPANELAGNIPQISQKLEQKFDTLRRSMKGLEEAAQKLDEVQKQVGASDKPTVAVEQPGSSTLQSVVGWTPSLFGQIMFTLFLLFFMLASGDLLYLKIVQSFDRLSEKRSAYLALREIEDSLGNYFGAITLINAALGVAIGLAMWAWGMPSPVLFGVGAFLFNFIPYLGSIGGVAVSTLVALIVLPGLVDPVLVGATYLTLTAIEGQLVTPYFVSRRLQMNTVVVFLAVALWAWLWSVLGMIIAVPVLVVLRVLSEHVPVLEKFGNFLAGDAPPALDQRSEGDADSAEQGAATAD